MPEHHFIISNRVSYPGYVVPGSLQVKCSQCGELVWIAPSSWLIMQDNPGTEILCMECGHNMRVVEPGVVEPPTLAQLDELKEKHRSHQ